MGCLRVKSSDTDAYTQNTFTPNIPTDLSGAVSRCEVLSYLQTHVTTLQPESGNLVTCLVDSLGGSSILNQL